ncbi:MAG: STAS/SEC14 domain-containing protein [Saprospiraceae bacterium]|nr:STAS/SEC14 domain-containing protein [Saprospiraceae bacterium]
MIERRTKTTTYKLREDGLIFSQVQKGSYVSLEDTVKGFELMKSMVPNQKLYIVSDLFGIKGTEKNARKFALDTEFVNKVGAIAFVTGSGASKIIANFVLRLNKMPYPSKMFTDRDKAIAWLKAQRDLELA